MELFGEIIKEPKSRKPIELANHTEVDYLETVKKNEIDLYENEYHLIEKSLNLPQKYMELSDIEQKMVLLFIDKDFIEPHSGKKTENSAFISFLASYHNKTVVKKLYKTETRTIGYDKQGNEMTEDYTIINAEELPLFTKLKLHALTLWKTNNLKEISKTMREIMTNDGFKDDELLEQKILSDAMSDSRDSFTIQNRRIAVDIKGMKKPQGLQQINVFLRGGGKEANKEIVDSTKNEVYDLIPEVEIVVEK
jgi:hypothetical protein